jgi:hypothetical protein
MGWALLHGIIEPRRMKWAAIIRATLAIVAMMEFALNLVLLVLEP